MKSWSLSNTYNLTCFYDIKYQPLRGDVIITIRDSETNGIKFIHLKT